MTAAHEIPFLLKLVDDDSPIVQEEVRRALISVADQLHEHLNAWEATASQRQAAHELLRSWRKSKLLSRWLTWQQQTEPSLALEEMHTILCDYACGWLYPWRLDERLDELAKELRGLSWREIPGRLFAERFQGQKENYYHPANSYLSHVLSSGAGNPISLCTILVLLGRRLELDIWGCNYPGHFLARIDGDEGLHLADCFRGGKILDPTLNEELRGELNPSQARSLSQIPATLEQMASRVLRNLVGAYLRQEQMEESNLFYFLLKDVAARDKGRGSSVALRETLYHPGQLVSHKVKDYRGVVVDYELYAPGSDGLAHEPEYRILVHRSPQVATARESSLQADASGSLVAHPFVAYFFSKFEDGVYLRNSRPWEG